MAGLWKLCLIAFSVTEMIIPLTAKPCFITNCPPGGKRSSQLAASSIDLQVISEERASTTRHQCVPCGPAGKGTCFGADLCCGSSFGCFFKTKETNTCLLFNNLTSSRLCDEHFWRVHMKAAICSLNGDNLDGVCVANNLCCSLGQCKTNSACVNELFRSQSDNLPATQEYYLPTLTVL